MNNMNVHNYTEQNENSKLESLKTECFNDCADVFQTVNGEGLARIRCSA